MGWLAERAVHVAERAGVATFRRVAHEWLAWRRDVKGGAPSTLSNDAAILREPGEPYKRGAGRSRAV